MKELEIWVVVMVVVTPDSKRKEELGFLGNILIKIQFRRRAVFPNTSNSTGFKLV